MIKHLEAFIGIADDGIVLTHRAQSDAATQSVHRVDVLDPILIHRVKHYGALEIAEGDGLDTLGGQGQGSRQQQEQGYLNFFHKRASTGPGSRATSAGR